MIYTSGHMDTRLFIISFIIIFVIIFACNVFNNKCVLYQEIVKLVLLQFWIKDLNGCRGLGMGWGWGLGLGAGHVWLHQLTKPFTPYIHTNMFTFCHLSYLLNKIQFIADDNSCRKGKWSMPKVKAMKWRISSVHLQAWSKAVQGYEKKIC